MQSECIEKHIFSGISYYFRLFPHRCSHIPVLKCFLKIKVQLCQSKSILIFLIHKLILFSIFPPQPKEGPTEEEPLAATRPPATPSTSQKPLKRPSPNPIAKVPSHNPLLKSTLQQKDAKRPPGTPQKLSPVGARSKQVNIAMWCFKENSILIHYWQLQKHSIWRYMNLNISKHCNWNFWVV